MSTFRRIERGFAIIGLAATAAAGLGCYALYSYHKDSDKSLSDLGRPTGLRGRKLPKEFILHLDLDRTTITDAPSSMTPWESFLSGETQTLSLRTVVKSIESAAEDERVKGFLTTGTHGVHGLAMIQELRNAVCKFNQAGKRLSSVFHTDTFGEADNKTLVYYLASAYKKIFMQPTGRMCTTGFSLSTPFFKDLLEKWRIKFRVWAKEEFKTAFNLFTEKEFTVPHREQMTWILDGIFNQVTAGISESRGMSQNEVEAAISAAPMSAQEAQAKGLLDRILYKDDIWTHMSDGQQLPTVSIRDYARIKAQEERKRKKKPEVAVMNLSGPIFVGWQPPSSQHPSICSARVAEQFNQLAKNENIKAVVLRLDSGGGSAVASDSIRQHIAKIKDAGKYVVVSMGNIAASGGYYISLGAHAIVANPGTLTGSIGVIVSSPFLKSALEEHGISVEVLKKGNNADMLSPFTEITPEQQTILDHLLDTVYNDFIRKVSEARNKPISTVESKAKGRIWLGADAYEEGLVDELGGLSEAIERAKSGAHLASDACVMEYPIPNRFVQVLSSLVHQFHLQVILPFPLPSMASSSSFELYSFEAEYILGSLS